MSTEFAGFASVAKSNAEAVRAPKTAELIARQIRNAIIRGDLKDGSMLPSEAHLIEEFGVSRPTIREAFRILESEGLITVFRGARGGAKVIAPNYGMVARAAGITLQAQGVTIGDLYEMRTLIEPPAARLVAERNSRVAVPILRQHIETEKNLAPDRFAVSHAVAEFHNLVIELAGNKTLLMFAQALRGLVSAHLQLAQHQLPPTSDRDIQKTFRRGFNSHSKLVDLIEARDGEAAEAHWRAHMVEAGRAWLARVGTNSVVDLIG